MSPSPRVAGLAVALLAGLAGAGTAPADPIEVLSGPVVLPLTGLALELPRDPRKGAVWALSGSWALTDSGASFDARDVIDQKVDGKLVAGTWIHLGYFDAGDCAAVVKELDVPDRWTTERDLWGHHWNVALGTWDFNNDLGKAPVIAMCAPRPNRASLLLYRFFVGDTTTLGADARLALIAKDSLLLHVTGAWEKDRTGPAQPTKRPEIKRRGDIEAARMVHLPKSAIDVTLPDDGFAWLARASDTGSTSDYLDRMAPAAPDITLEIARVADAHCDKLFPATGPDAPKRIEEPARKNIPAGWKSLGTMVLETNLERIVCREGPAAALVVGFITTPNDAPDARDLASFAPVLAALAAASEVRN